MNVSELARKLNISQQELREVLPQVGFDIGARAIKVDQTVAQKILKSWARLYGEYLEQQRKIKEEKEKEIAEQNGEVVKEVKIIKIPQFITVKDFAISIDTPLVRVMEELMKNGVLATLNDKVDFDTASIIADEFGYKAEEKEEDAPEQQKEDALKNILSLEKKETLKNRPPVVVVMGHVDHGKTRLLDTIRKTNVIDKEAGGITQHMGSYQVVKSISNVDGKKEDRIITFIDTPGHEAFTAMRSRGARIADIAILVVAADDGVKPQTKEAIKIIEQAGLPIIVAINKIDKEGANIEKTKQELSQLNLMPEDWGGKTMCLPISAKEGTGISELLENIILTADFNEERIKANPLSSGIGTVIESHIDKGEGPVATVIVQNGTARKNDYIYIGGELNGKIKSMKDYNGCEIEEALPSTPIKIIGFKNLPRVGDIVIEGKEKTGKGIKKKNFGKTSEELDWHKKDEKVESGDQEGVKQINIILKGDVVGSLEAIIESLAKIESSEVKINLIKKGLGNVTEVEVLNAEASGAIILGFNVMLTQDAEKLALEKGVEFHKYKIIYELLEFIKDIIVNLTEPKYENVLTGKMKVAAIFRTERKNMIVGGRVVSGEVYKDSSVKVLRDGKIAGEGKILSLESAKQAVNVLCTEDQECGVKFEGNIGIEENDVLEFWIKKEIKK